MCITSAGLRQPRVHFIADAQVFYIFPNLGNDTCGIVPNLVWKSCNNSISAGCFCKAIVYSHFLPHHLEHTTRLLDIDRIYARSVNPYDDVCLFGDCRPRQRRQFIPRWVGVRRSRDGEHFRCHC